MTTFTYDAPATLTTRSGLRIFAYINTKGAIIGTDEVRALWAMLD